MNPDEQREFEQMKTQLSELHEFISKFMNGNEIPIKVLGRTPDTTASAGIIISTQDGPVTVLVV